MIIEKKCRRSCCLVDLKLLQHQQVKCSSCLICFYDYMVVYWNEMKYIQIERIGVVVFLSLVSLSIYMDYICIYLYLFFVGLLVAISSVRLESCIVVSLSVSIYYLLFFFFLIIYRERWRRFWGTEITTKIKNNIKFDF